MVDIHVLEEAPLGTIRPLAAGLGLSDVLARVLWQRGLREVAAAKGWLKPDVSDIEDPYLFDDMEKAVGRIRDALRRRERILIHGDYDVDGLTGTVLLLSFLKLVGAEADYHIPARDEGYSFSPRSVARIRDGGFGVCISVDNGTAAISEIARIQEIGCDVIVTDHHHTGPDIAPAHAILNPRLENSGYPFPHLAGCAVAFKLAWAIAESFSPRRILADELRTFLIEAASLVALGSVADVVPLIGENRTLVRVGLKALAHSKSPGMRALIDNLGPRGSELVADDISYRIGPRLNAAGRMGHASLAVRLLCATSYGEARQLAAEIESLNRTRQKVEAEIATEAIRKIEADPLHDQRRVLLVAGADWHLGVVGIVAARLTDLFGRPAIVLALQDGRARGSGRSCGGFDLKALLDRLQSHLPRYGGHAAAVGLELPAAELPAFEAALEDACSGLPPIRPAPLEVEARASLAHWTTRELRRLADFRPFGHANPPPCFLAEGVRLGTGLRRVGASQRGLAFTAIADGTAVKALAPTLGPRIEEFLAKPTPWSLVYTPRLAARSDASPIEIQVHAMLEREPTYRTGRVPASGG